MVKDYRGAVPEIILSQSPYLRMPDAKDWNDRKESRKYGTV
jgi:hypothetical protein